MADRRFTHYLRLSAVWHFAVILFLIIAPLVFNWRLRKKNRQFITFVDLTVALPEVPSVKAVEEVKAPEPPAPEVKKDIPEPAKSKIQKSTKLIKKPAPKPKTPPLTQEEIKKLLAAGARISDRTSIPADAFPAAWYYALVRQTMYDAWNQPSTLSNTAGLVVEVTIRVMRDGTIVKREVNRRSGNALMDDSVQKAVNSVYQLKPLPPEFGGPYKDIVIEFELTQGSV